MKKYITYLIRYSIRPEVCGKRPLAEENGLAGAARAPAPLHCQSFESVTHKTGGASIP